MWYKSNENFTKEIYHLYNLVYQVIAGGSIFYYNPGELECNWLWFQQNNFTIRPQWVWYNQAPYGYLKMQHNSEIFVLACLSENYTELELTGLSESLFHLRNVRVLIELAGGDDYSVNANEDSVATSILSYCLQNSMLNVVLYFKHRSRPLTLYSFKAFPHFILLKHRITEQSSEGQLYPNQMMNLGGYKLLVMPDFSEPNTILYRDANGTSRITGFMWHFMETFAAKLGASLTPIHPTWPTGRSLGEPYMLEFTKNGSVDFGLLPVLMDNKNSKRQYQYSYPILYGSWCIMLPRERPIDKHAILGRVLRAETLILLLIAFGCAYLSYCVGHFRFPHWIRYYWRYMRLTPRLLYLPVLCACLAQLTSLMIMCPQQTRIDSFDALLASDLRIFGLQSEFYTLHDEFRARYASAFILTRNITKLFEMRNSFNTSWAYSILTTKWLVLDAQQRHFQRPLFRYSELCLYGHAPYSIMIAEESIYRETLQLFSMKTLQSGLFDYWLRHSFYDMVTAGRMQFKDYSIPNHPRPLRLQDLQLACRCYGLGILLALLLFVIDLLRFYTKVCLDSL